jgi:hypothetical protein
LLLAITSVSSYQLPPLNTHQASAFKPQRDLNRSNQIQHILDQIATMKTPLSLLFSTFLLFALPAFAQFQFFEQMFNQGGQQQQQAQNAPSDSAWYKQQYEAGMSINSTRLSTCYAVE